jgi:hypothetical protein
MQIAATLGAEVTGVQHAQCRAVRSIGAAHVVDYTTEDSGAVSAPAGSVLPRVARHARHGQSTAQETTTTPAANDPAIPGCLLHRRQESRQPRSAPGQPGPDADITANVTNDRWKAFFLVSPLRVIRVPA